MSLKIITKIAMLALALAIFLAAPAFAHKTSYGALKATFTGESLSGQLELAVRDFDKAFFDLAFGPPDGSSKVDWAQLDRHEQEISTLLMSKIALGSPNAPCALSPDPIDVEVHSGEPFLILPFTGVCKGLGDTLEVRYDLLFDIDPQHRAMIDVRRGDEVYSGLITPESKLLQFSIRKENLKETIISYIHQGAHHIWIGYDHILFLLSLLLPAVLWRDKDKWLPVRDLTGAFWNTAKIVTAFTLAHSVTLSLAAFGVIELPSRFTESAIAASIMIAAINNIFPIITRRLWIVAFFFGLVHGFGFASVLTEFGLPPDRKIVALVSFNIGVELGQLVIVAVLLPILFLARRSAAYPRIAVPAGSLVITCVALIWLVERVTGVGDFLGG